MICQQQAGCAHAEQLNATRGQHVEEVDDVEVISQSVRELDKCLRETLFPIHSRASQLISANSRAARAQGPRSGALDRSIVIVIKSRPPRHNVSCHIGQRTVMAERVGAQADECHRLGHAKLDTDHPGGLMNLGAVPGRLFRYPLGFRAVGEVSQQCPGRGAGEDKQVN